MKRSLIGLAVLASCGLLSAQTRPISPEGVPFGIILYGAAVWPGSSDLVLLWSKPPETATEPNLVATLDGHGRDVRLEIVGLAVLDPRPCAQGNVAIIYADTVFGSCPGSWLVTVGTWGFGTKFFGSPLPTFRYCGKPTDVIGRYHLANCPGYAPSVTFVLARPIL